MEGEESDAVEHFKPRPYQAQLEEIAVENNTIIYLPTGSGKTFIAICLIKRFRHALKKPWGQGGKRTFFLVNTVPLVTQQVNNNESNIPSEDMLIISHMKKVIEELCAVEGVGAYSGESGVDYWDKDKWDAELAQHQVIVMTSQILSDMLMHQYIRIEDINLLIFDECHHAVVDHPMRLVMKHFEVCPKENQPRVLGLTATLLNANVKTHKVEDTLHELEITFHAKIATVDELGKVLNYSTNPNEMVQTYSRTQPTEVSALVIRKLMVLHGLIAKIELPSSHSKHNIQLKNSQKNITGDPQKAVKAVKNMISSMIMFIEDFGLYGGALAILAYIIIFERLKRKTTTKEEEMLYKIAITHSVDARAILLKAMDDKTGYEKIVKYSSEKVLLTLNVLKEYSPKVLDTPGVTLKVNKSRKPLSAIIFTQQRFTAKILYNLLKDVIDTNPAEYDFLKHDFIVGFNVNPYNNTREEYYLKKASQQALLKFRNSDLNCLIATSVIEEGIDIPQCILVLRYDPPLEYRSYIQSKGRARSSESSYVILIEKSQQNNFMKSYEQFQHTEQIIQRILIGSSDDRNEPTSSAIDQQLYKDEDVEPFITPNGSRLSSVSAISLLNRYCSVLPHDQFTVIIPIWIQERVFDNNGVERRLVTIVMPIACPIKEEIKGLPRYNLKAAKRSAALNACIKLYEAGELDPLTLLPVRYTAVDFDDSDVKSCFANWRDDDVGDADSNLPYPGTKARVRKHRIQFPRLLNSVPEDVYYLHIIKSTTAFQEPKDSREKALYNLLQRKEGYGLLTQQPLPRLCEFPMFMTVGEVATSIDVNYAVIKLNQKLFEIVKGFHYFLFEQVLAIAKKFLVFEGKVNCMYVVPVKDDNGYDIDWNVMTTYTEIAPVQPTSYEERLFINVTPENYKDCVVTPWYRVQPDSVTQPNLAVPAWQRKVERRIDRTRLLISKLHRFREGSTEPRVMHFVKQAFLGSGVSPLRYKSRVTERIDFLKRKVCTWTNKIRKHKRRIEPETETKKSQKRKEQYEQRYIVSNVLEYMTPQSQFDSDSYLTFADYYADKYKLEVIGEKTQPLLEVRNISSRMNCLLPRAATINALTDKQRKLVSASQGDDKTSRGFAEVFVAEFCVKYDYPGVLWYKAIMLPSIIHRVFMLLVAHELLTEIAEKTKFGTPIRKKSTDWLPVKGSILIATNSLLAQVEEPTPINSVDRINNAVDDDSSRRPNVLSIKDSLYRLQQKKLSKEYPWDERMEPIDIERNLSSVSVMDVECYDEFVSAPLIASPRSNYNVRSPQSVYTHSAAISAPPAKYNDQIQLLKASATGKGPELRDILAALTTIKSHDTFNLERVETLGDSFLKFAASLYLYHKFPKLNEGQLTNIKCRLISNRNLYYAGERFNLGGRMKIDQFSPRNDFMLPGFFAPKEVEDFIAEKQIRPIFLIGVQFPHSEVLDGNLSKESMDMVRDRYTDCDGAAEIEPRDRAQNAMQLYVHSQAVPDKSVADCVEALIGTYLLSGGLIGAIKVIEWMRIIPPQDDFAEYLHLRVPTAITDKKATEQDIDFLLRHCRDDVEKILNYKFNDPSFLLEALSHPSYIRNRLTRSYERMEFLGDAILDFLITSHIFEHCGELKPGEMTDLRSALVNNVTFASYVVKLGLHKFLCSELNPTLDTAIVTFVEHQIQRDHEIVEDVLYMMDEEECSLAEYIEVPKVLSDIFEALVGAIYLDCGGDLQVVWSVVYRIMCKEIHDFSCRIPQQPVKILYEKIHACPTFRKPEVIDPDIPKIRIGVTITKNDWQHTVYGIGRNKAQAKRAAAKMALKVLGL
ncbi:endoribonuclease Dcr-2 isoform X1 [Helicoverpa armigera]|uniref:endoribonuclease Dcr-2 isoform X1 n=1 Tax=Helicoverpa armigera TaxID=29058 RepID=UPI0030837C8A